MSQRVLLHVGTPKTGTSYLQDVLFRNRPVLAEAGILYPAERFDEHFLAALDLMRLPWGGLETEALGAWDRLAGLVRDWDGTAVVSHEILANASRAQVQRALTSLGHPETEVHVVLSVRDLVRQIPAEWQENVKHRRELSYARFLQTIQDPAREGRIATWFWGVQEIPDILGRWCRDLPPERVHLVTVPGPGEPPQRLWERFTEAFGLTDLELDLQGERSNPSLGAPETALLRRINIRANPVIEPPRYRPLVRELLAHQTLSRRVSTPRLTLPGDAYAWTQELTGAWIDEIKDRGYDVIGDLGDLVGKLPAQPYSDPDHPDEAEVADAALDAITALLRENARLLEAEQRLAGELEQTRHDLQQSYLRPAYRMRKGIVRRLDGNRLGRGLLAAYRALGRSSRSA